LQFCRAELEMNGIEHKVNQYSLRLKQITLRETIQTLSLIYSNN
jgi:hypothetical protein